MELPRTLIRIELEQFYDITPLIGILTFTNTANTCYPIQFRSLLRQSSQFAAYNFREYAKRRTKDAFREHSGETEERRIQDLMQKGLKELQIMKLRDRRRYCLHPFLPPPNLFTEAADSVIVQGKQTGGEGDIIRQTTE
ncbi:MAG: hypothetical protein Q9201_000994 [Fulgogasparrea decipioides]